MNIKRLKKHNCESCGQVDTGFYPDTFYPNNCFYEGLSLHHLIPLNCGGNHLESNLMTLCQNCHKKVHTQPDGKNNWSLINEDFTDELINIKNEKQ